MNADEYETTIDVIDLWEPSKVERIKSKLLTVDTMMEITKLSEVKQPVWGTLQTVLDPDNSTSYQMLEEEEKRLSWDGISRFSEGTSSITSYKSKVFGRFPSQSEKMSDSD